MSEDFVAEGVQKTYRGASGPVLNIPELTVREGELLVLLGPSGCGKTTFLKIIAGLITADSGRLTLGDRIWFDAERRVTLPPERRGIGMVFQNYALWPHMTAAANVGYPLKATSMPKDRRRTRIDELLVTVRCAGLGHRYPAELSGGQQQRIALARALASSPRMMLFDEPLSNLDAQLRDDLRRDIRALHRSKRFTGVFVTHDQLEALHLATRIVVLREGQIAQSGAPQEVSERPATPYVAQFFGMGNSVRVGALPSGSVGVLTAGATRLLEPDDQLYFRSEDVVLAYPDAAVDPDLVLLGNAEMQGSSYEGLGVEYVLRFAEMTVVCHQAQVAARYAVGDALRIYIERNKLVAFRGDQRVSGLADTHPGQPPEA